MKVVLFSGSCATRDTIAKVQVAFPQSMDRIIAQKTFEVQKELIRLVLMIDEIG